MSEAERVRRELAGDPFTSNADYGRLVEEAARADEVASWAAERDNEAAEVEPTHDGRMSPMTEDAPPAEPPAPMSETEAIARLAEGVVHVGAMLERATGTLADSIAQTRAEQAELRDELVAVANRLEGLTRKVTAMEADDGV